VTGYGEELIKNAFSVDIGIVETMAHFTAARNRPEGGFHP
jgi:activator of 2-hydroxyglutaryl-CoA dehydratase